MKKENEMTIAQTILSQASGANEARNFALKFNFSTSNISGVDVLTFEDNSTLLFFGFSLAVMVGKGQ
jgi:hypothetical protein